MRLFFLTILKPLSYHPIKKKIIHSALPSGLEALRAGSEGVGSTLRPVSPTGWKRSRRLIFKDLGEKLPDPSIYL